MRIGRVSLLLLSHTGAALKGCGGGRPLLATMSTRASQASSAAPRGRKRALEVAEPPGWRRQFDMIKELRKDRTAVVDSMGAEQAAAGAADADRPYHTLISLMISSQTKDTVNAQTMRKLRAHGLSVENILATPDEILNELIREVGFHNNKTRYIKETTRIIAADHGGRVPDTMEALLALPGVGPKMALILLHVAFGQCVGISVDTHVHRIANQLQWTGAEPTRAPEKTREALEAWMPRDVWPEVNVLLVGFGQEIQADRQKLLGKCLAASDPEYALDLVRTCGLKVEAELVKRDKLKR